MSGLIIRSSCLSCGRAAFLPQTNVPPLDLCFILLLQCCVYDMCYGKRGNSLRNTLTCWDVDALQDLWADLHHISVASWSPGSFAFEQLLNLFPSTPEQRGQQGWHQLQMSSMPSKHNSGFSTVLLRCWKLGRVQHQQPACDRMHTITC
jgi:hypothetical protein